ncbi:MAG: leucine-rich repeat domain-containing protein [Oscillospiraceae bacterium]|nr:leucine-rich repeat domain-containing protein [Oscillospiraceae bacterium]
MNKLMSVFFAVTFTITILPNVAMFAEEVRVTIRSGGITNEQLAEMVANGEIPYNVTHLDLSGDWTLDSGNFTINGKISDITPLRDLTNLRELDLSFNQISDLSPLYRLTNLRSLHLKFNQISDISPLCMMFRLEYLDLNTNPLRDISPLYDRLPGLVNLQTLSLLITPITYEQIKALQKELPDLRIYHNARPTPGHVLGNLDITIFDALEILKYIVGIDNVIDNDAMALEAALIVSDDVPGIFDVLEILKFLVGIDGILKELYSQ